MTETPIVAPSGFQNTKRLQRGNQIVGTVVKNDYGQWSLYDADKRLMTTRTFENPKSARDAFVLLEVHR